MRRLGFILTALFCTIWFVSPSVAGPDCRKTPQAGPCQPKPTPSPTATPSPTPDPTTPTPTPTETVVAGAATPPSSVDDTGATDTTASLNAWLESLPDGSTADLGAGTYRLEGSVRLDDKTGLTIRGGTLIRRDNATDTALVYPNPNPMLWLLRCTRCTVAGTTFRSTNTISDNPDHCPNCGSYDVRWEFDAAIRAESFTDLTLTGLDIDAMWGDGIQLQVGSGATVTSTRIARNGRQGIAVLASHVVIDGVDIVSSRRSGIDLEPDQASQSFGDVKILNTRIWSWLLAITAGGPGEFSDVEIGWCTIVRSSSPYINADSSSGGLRDRWNIHHLDAGDRNVWLIDGGNAPRIQFWNSHGSSVTDSYIPINSNATYETVVGAWEGSTVNVERDWAEYAGLPVAADMDGTSTVTQSNNTAGGTPPVGYTGPNG